MHILSLRIVCLSLFSLNLSAVQYNCSIDKQNKGSNSMEPMFALIALAALFLLKKNRDETRSLREVVQSRSTSMSTHRPIVVKPRAKNAPKTKKVFYAKRINK